MMAPRIAGLYALVTAPVQWHPAQVFEEETAMLKIEFTKGSDRDWIVATRDDGSVEKLSFPKKGLTVHDAVHFFVERDLSLHDAFWGKVEKGSNPEEIQVLAKAGGHASATRAEQPDDSIIELLQAERLVECFEADAWGQPADAESFLEIAKAACESAMVPMPEMDAAKVEQIRENIAAFHADWIKAPAGYTSCLLWRR